MRNYEVTFIVDPVLSGDEIKATAQKYSEHLEKAGCKIVHFDEMGLHQLAYPINKRSSGIYYCIEFETPTGDLIDELELTFRRDERILRFLTVKLDKYGVKYNEDKRNGLIGKAKKQKPSAEAEGAPVAATAASERSVAPEKKTPAPIAPVVPLVEDVAVEEKEVEDVAVEEKVVEDVAEEEKVAKPESTTATDEISSEEE